MKNHLLISLMLLMGIAACQNLDSGEGSLPENSFFEKTGSKIVFSHEGKLSLNAISDTMISAQLLLQAEAIDNADAKGHFSWDTLYHANFSFYFKDIPCHVNKNKVHLVSKGLRGSCQCRLWYSGSHKTGTQAMSGYFYFDERLNREKSLYGWESRLGEGDILTGDWVIRFEADDETRLLFKVRSVEIVRFVN